MTVAAARRQYSEGMSRRLAQFAAAAASGLVLTMSLSACAPPAPDITDSSATPSPAATTATPAPIATITPGATPSADALLPLPTDCLVILNDDVIEQLGSTPLNDPDTGVDTGVQDDGSLVCLWRDPRADTTFLMTTISYASRGPALDLMNELADDEDFTCYTPDEGTRCEKTWENETYPVTDGRTVYWRDDVLIDTTYSNLAPSGYTDAIVASVFG